MATYESATILTFIAGEDLNDDDHKLLMLNSAGRVVLATSVVAPIIGILAENPKNPYVVGDVSTGRSVAVAMLSGIIKAKALGAVTAGNLAIWGTGGLVADSGVAVLTSLVVDNFVVGIFKQSGVANQIVEIVGMPLIGAGS